MLKTCRLFATEGCRPLNPLNSKLVCSEKTACTAGFYSATTRYSKVVRQYAGMVPRRKLNQESKRKSAFAKRTFFLKSVRGSLRNFTIRFSRHSLVHRCSSVSLSTEGRLIQRSSRDSTAF